MTRKADKKEKIARNNQQQHDYFPEQERIQEPVHSLPKPIMARSVPKQIPLQSSVHSAIPPHSSIHTPSSLHQYNSLQQASVVARRSIVGSYSSAHSKGGVGSYPSVHSRPNSIEPDSDHIAVNLIISEHLVDPTREGFSSVSHSLQGGFVTRDIYKWKEERFGQHQRRKSEPDLLIPPLEGNISSDLRAPGMFRRQFIRDRAVRLGRPKPNFLTRNFIDFLVLYGAYGGDVYPSDSDDDDEDELDYEDVNVENPTDSSPLIPRVRTSAVTRVKGTSKSKAFFMLTKAFVAFSDGGLLFSIILMIFFALLTLHCMLLLSETSQVFGNKSFGDLGFEIYGERFRNLILYSIAISQMGFCCAYFIFVGQNLRDLVMLTSNCQVILPDWCFILVQLVIYIPLALVRRIKNFGVTALIADVFILVGLFYIFTFDIVALVNDGPKPVVPINTESFSLFVGTAMFAFEGICLMLPISQSMERPREFPKVLTWCMFTISAIFLSIGSLGYLALGDKVETVIFLNLPKGGVTSSIQFVYILAIILSFPLTVYPAIRITEQSNFDKLGIFGISTGKASSLIKWEKNFYRAALVSMLGLVSWLGSANLDKVVSVVGCFACIPLSFIYPAMLHFKTSKSGSTRFKDGCIIAFGTIAMIYTTSVTLHQWATGGSTLPIDRCSNAIAL